MNTYRIALVGAVSTCILWTAKATAIGLAGGADRSPLESPLFLAGLVACVATMLSLGLHLTRGRPAWQRALGALGLVTATIGVVPLLVAGVDALVAPSAARHWAWYEVNLWVTALGVLAVTLLSRPRRAAARRAPRRAPAAARGR